MDKLNKSISNKQIMPSTLLTNPLNFSAVALYSKSKIEADLVLLNFCNQLKKQGVRVNGLLQHLRDKTSPSKAKVSLLNIADGQQYFIAQDLGAGSSSCCLDISALAQAGKVLQQINSTNTDLVVINRFAAIEAEGLGFRAEMLQFISQGIPLITVTKPAYFDDWQKFIGAEQACVIPADQAELLQQWWQQISC